MDTKDLVIIATIAKFGSITKAAEHLGMSQPGVTKFLRHIEDEVGVRLIERSLRGAAPTRFGEVLVRYGSTIITEFSKAKAELMALVDGALGEVTIGTIAMGAANIVPLAVERVSRAHPEYSIGILENSDDVLYSALEAGLLDVVFAPFAHDDPRRFEETVFFHDRLSLFVGKSHPLVGRKAIKLSSLLSYDWVLPPRTSRLRQFIRSEFEYLGHKEPSSRVETASIRATVMLVEKNNRIVLLPSNAVRTELQVGRIRALPVQLRTPLVPFGTSTRAGATLSPAVRSLVIEMRQVAIELEFAGPRSTPPANR